MSGKPASDGIFSKTTGETYTWGIDAAPEGKAALEIISRYPRHPMVDLVGMMDSGLHLSQINGMRFLDGART